MTDRAYAHRVMGLRLQQLRVEFEELASTARFTRGLSGWMFRRAVKHMMKTIEALEVEMMKGTEIITDQTNRLEKCSHGDFLEYCAMPLCLEIKTGRHYRAQKEARKIAHDRP